MSYKRTVIEWLYELPDGYRELALANLDHMFSGIVTTRIYSAIACGLKWGKLPEGDDFWHDVRNHYLHNTPLPPLPSGTPQDSIVTSVIEKFKERSEKGISKYGVTLDRTDLKTIDWINHAQEEAMDFVLYLERLKKEV